MTRRVRWECPSGKHPGVLGSTRPRMNATVRYCLPCSEAEGFLVERVAPALENERAARTATVEKRQAQREQRKRTAAQQQNVLTVREADGSHGEVNIKQTLEQMMRLPALRNYAEQACPYVRLQAPAVTLRRSATKSYSSGHAPYYNWRFVVTAAVDPTREDFEELLLHELLHLLMPGEHHNQRYRARLALAAREWWPGLTVKASDHNSCHGMDQAIAQAARKLK